MAASNDPFKLAVDIVLFDERVAKEHDECAETWGAETVTLLGESFHLCRLK